MRLTRAVALLAAMGAFHCSGAAAGDRYVVTYLEMKGPDLTKLRQSLSDFERRNPGWTSVVGQQLGDTSRFVVVQSCALPDADARSTDAKAKELWGELTPMLVAPADSFTGVQLD